MGKPLLPAQDRPGSPGGLGTVLTGSARGMTHPMMQIQPHGRPPCPRIPEGNSSGGVEREPDPELDGRPERSSNRGV